MRRVRTTNSLPDDYKRGFLARRAIRCFFAAVVCALVAFVAIASADDNQALDQFLSRLGLADLRLTHMEQVLARESSLEKRTAMARNLANGYAEELIAAADEQERFEKLKARAEKLLAAFPEARTAAASVA